jgi:hypothetical protein
MDVLSLSRKGKLPSAFTPTSTHHFTFTHWSLLIGLAWAAAAAVLALRAARAWPSWRARLRGPRG